MDKKRLRGGDDSLLWLRGFAPLALICTLALLAPGCLQGGGSSHQGVVPLTAKEIGERLSAPVHVGITYEEATVVGANGTSIWFDVYRPKDATDRVPVILTMTPYRTPSDTQSNDCTSVPRQQCAYDTELVSFFVPRGYAVAFADVRGNHNSGSCMDFVGGDSRKDAYAVVEKLAAQPWSTGRVAMYGISYDASMALGAAVLQPPHLVTVIAMSAVTSQYDYAFYEGVPYKLRAPQTEATYLKNSAPPGPDPNAASGFPARFDCQPANVEASVDQSGDWNSYWEARDLRPLAGNIRASILQTQGLQDTNVKPDSVEGFWSNITSEKRLIVGQWTHDFPQRVDWTLIRHRWLDHYLKGIDTGILADLPPVLTEDTSGTWRGIDGFPSAHPTTTTLYPGADGSLSQAPQASGSRALQDYPRGTLEEWYATLVAGPAAQATGTPPKLAFVTTPLAEDLHVTGSPFVRLVASTNAKSTHWIARLSDADAPTDPILNDSEQGTQIVDRGYLDARHRAGVKHPADLSPGETYNATIRLLPLDLVIPKGHRLAIVLDNNDDLVQQDTTFATSTVRVGGDDATTLTLPLADPGVPIPKDALRPGLAS